MLRIRPFEAIRPRADLAARVASVPYDVVDTGEARALALDNRHCFLHVVRPEIDLPPGTDIYDDSVYETARLNLARLIDDGVLLREPRPRLYVYRQIWQGRAQAGIVCCCHVDDYAADRIKKHEKTRKQKEDDRTRHVMTSNANTGPVFLTYRDRPSIDALVVSASAGSPLFDFTAPDGVQHTVWTVSDSSALVDAFAAEVPCAYVADGHHRSASAARAGAERRADNPEHTGDEEYNWFLTVLFPASQLAILPYNRVLRDLNGHTPDALVERLREVGRVTDADDPHPRRPGVFCLYLAGRWLEVELDPASIDADDPIASLDVDLVQQRVLAPIFGIEDPRTSDRVDFVGGIRGTEELERRVDGGAFAAAISMHPTTIDQLLSVADAGLVMPPKSTWFEPKLRSGLFVHSLD